MRSRKRLRHWADVVAVTGDLALDQSRGHRFRGRGRSQGPRPCGPSPGSPNRFSTGPPEANDDQDACQGYSASSERECSQRRSRRG